MEDDFYGGERAAFQSMKFDENAQRAHSPLLVGAKRKSRLAGQRTARGG